MHINELLTTVVDLGGSDLHLKVGNFPIARVKGRLTPLTQFKKLVQEDTIAMAYSIMASDRQKAKFKESLDIDLAYSVPALGRFRCNIFNQRGTVGMVLRVIPRRIFSIEDLMLPRALNKICEEQRGMVLVTGTTGSGKSTTLAAMIDLINATRNEHILTIEDPIEYLHRDNLSIINQREVGADCSSFATALRAALRQDPDVILVGEMRDLETIETAIHAAETGHLVFSTLHTLDATETINRVISVFPPHHQKQIRLQLSGVLKAVISQRLVPRADGQGRVPAVRGAHRHRDGPHLHRGQGPDQGPAGRHRPGHQPVRHADLRPEPLLPAPGRPHHGRGSPQARHQCGRVQAPAGGRHGHLGHGQGQHGPRHEHHHRRRPRIRRPPGPQRPAWQEALPARRRFQDFPCEMRRRLCRLFISQFPGTATPVAHRAVVFVSASALRRRETAAHQMAAVAAT